jgi:hypothetical protein
MRRYLVLFVVALVTGVLLAIAGRLPHETAGTGARPAPRTASAVALAIGDAGLEPARSSVPSGALVALTIENHTPRPVSIALTGYEDRLEIGALGPHGRWSGSFVADRPGDDFAWVVNGVPAGRFTVTGSHLVEGHE